MDLKKNIIRIFLVALWVVLGASITVLLVAAINIKNHKSCKGIEIDIRGVKEIYFLDKTDIIKILTDEGIGNPAGLSVAGFNLQRLETKLEKNVWVKDAELFFDNNLVLHINILEKEPVARIFTNSGSSFYMDSSGSRMPLNNKMNVKLPVFTGFPTDKNEPSKADSLLTEHIKRITLFLLNNEFWMAQIAQIDITPDKNFEMIPTVGNHIIQFGDGDKCESKFRRLFIFYRQVLSQAGMDKYSRVNVQYSEQVIGTKKGMVTKIDSIQALKNIQAMIEEAKRITEDSVYVNDERNIPFPIPADSAMQVFKMDTVNRIRKKAFMPDSNKLIQKPKALMKKPTR